MGERGPRNAEGRARDAHLPSCVSESARSCTDCARTSQDFHDALVRLSKTLESIPHKGSVRSHYVLTVLQIGRDRCVRSKRNTELRTRSHPCKPTIKARHPPYAILAPLQYHYLHPLHHQEWPSTRALPHPLPASLPSHPTPLAQTFLPLIGRLTDLASSPKSNPPTARV